MRISDCSSDVCSSDLLRVPFDLGRLLRAPLPQGRGERRIGDPVAAAHRRRQEAARDLVHALGAGLERRQSFAQAVLDALVVSGLEVQSRQLPERAPVASVQRVRAAPAQRAGDRRTEEQTSELQYLMRISYAVFCLKKKRIYNNNDE